MISQHLDACAAMKRTALNVARLVALLVATGPAFAAEFYYGLPVPTVSGAVAQDDWNSCIVSAASRLDDRVSPVMDIASAIEPLCRAKETTMIEAINKDFLAKNPGIEANMTFASVRQMREEAHATFRQAIGTIILAVRKRNK